MTNETTCIIKPPIPPIIQIHGTDGRALLTIHPNGTVEGDIEDASEAARVFVEHIRRLVALPTQSDALLDAEGVKLYWYRQGKDDGVEHERAKIVAWLMREEDDYPSGKYSGFAAMIREEIEAGEHLKEQSK